jgi:hypothetical protein
MKLTDPGNSYARKILERGKPIKQLRKLAAKEDVNTGPFGEISILISSLAENDFNYLLKPINELLKQADEEVAKFIIRRIPEEKIARFAKSIAERFTEVVEVIPKSQAYLFLKVAAREIPANNGHNAAEIIKFMSNTNKFDVLNKSITQAIQNDHGSYLDVMLAAIPAEKIPNFTEVIADAIICKGNEKIISAIPTERLRLFIQPIWHRMIKLAPSDLKQGVSTEALGFIKAIPAKQISHFIEPIGIIIAKISNEASSKPIGLLRICHKYLDAILKHVPIEHRRAVVEVANDNISSSAERERLTAASIALPKSWAERLSQEALSIKVLQL